MLCEIKAAERNQITNQHYPQYHFQQMFLHSCFLACWYHSNTNRILKETFSRKLLSLELPVVAVRKITKGNVFSPNHSDVSLRPGSSCPEVFSKKGVLRNFTKFTGKHLCQSLFFNKVFFKKETLTQVFSCEFCEMSKNTFGCKTEKKSHFSFNL